jgi:hypothetical protein
VRVQSQAVTEVDPGGQSGGVVVRSHWETCVCPAVHAVSPQWQPPGSAFAPDPCAGIAQQYVPVQLVCGFTAPIQPQPQSVVWRPAA